MATQTVEQKVGQWLTAFNVIKEELTSKEARQSMMTMQSRPPEPDESEASYLRTQVAIAQQVASIIAANDRTAATVAGLLVQSGIKVPVDYGED